MFLNQKKIPLNQAVRKEFLSLTLNIPNPKLKEHGKRVHMPSFHNHNKPINKQAIQIQEKIVAKIINHKMSIILPPHRDNLRELKKINNSIRKHKIRHHNKAIRKTQDQEIY